MTVPDPREEMLKLRALVAADQQHLADIDQTIGRMYDRRGEVLDRFQANQARLRSMEVAHYARFAADASVEAADVRDQAQKRGEDFRGDAA
jgi:hypothetical protein